KDNTGMNEALEGSVLPAFQEVRDSLDRLKKVRAEQAAGAAEQARKTYVTALWTVGALLVVGLVGAVLLGLVVARAISRPLSRCLGVLVGIQQGDLAGRVRLRSRDEIGRLAAALDDTAESLAGMV